MVPTSGIEICHSESSSSSTASSASSARSTSSMSSTTGSSEVIASSSGRGARNRSEKKMLSCLAIRSIDSFRSGASAMNSPIFSRRICV